MPTSRQFGSAQKLIDELGITEPSELNIEAIAQYCGATITYAPLTGCEARIIGVNDRAIITVTSNATRPRQRFSAGHELGHWMRDRGKTAFACTDASFRSEWGSNSVESRANEFAAELLMPEKIFDPRVRSREITFTTVEEMTSTFGTSLTATAIRLVQRGSYPSMVLFLKDGKRKWFVRGPDVPTFLWPLDVPGPGSIAADLLKGAVAEKEALEVYADNWISHKNSKYYGIVEDSRRVGSDGILTLLWWEDEKQLLDLIYHR